MSDNKKELGKTTTTKKTIDTETAKALEIANEQLKQKDAELEALKKEFADIKNLIMQNSLQQPQTIVQNVVSNDRLRSDEYIPVENMMMSRLNLNAGDGTIISFKEMGEVQNITFGELNGISRNHSKFVRDGGIYILHEKAVAELGLKESYTRILERKALQSLIDTDIDNIVNTLKTLTDVQRKSFEDYLIEVVSDGRDIGRFKLNEIAAVLDDKIDPNDIDGKDDHKSILTKIDEMQEAKREMRAAKQK